MNFILKYSPEFFKRFDAKLRINYPWLWATRIHITLYASLIFTILFTLVGLGFSLDIKDLPSEGDSAIFFTLLIIPTLVFGVFIIYHMALFNSDKSFGKKFMYQEFFVFLIYLISFISAPDIY